MIKQATLFFALMLLINLSSCLPQENYKNQELTFKERVEDMISRMTLEEKVSQLSYNSPQIAHLNIPEYNWWNECLHGVGRAGKATVFPQAIGMAAMWDKEFMFDIANAISDEARAKYHQYVKEDDHRIYHGLTFWSPNINIFRDPRWGRGMETYGEDPYLTGELGVSFIKGLQGNNDKYYKLIATAKHFVVHSGPESSRHSFNAIPKSYDFIDTYTPHFKKAVQEAKVYSIMCAYNRYNNMPCCGNTELNQLLRNEWGFNGYIVSDCWAVHDFYDEDAHEVVNTKAEASAMAVKAGTDLNCGNSYSSLTEAVTKGYIKEEELDVALERLLLARMKLGMFDDDKSVPFASIPYSVVDSKEHQEMALKAACKSMVLLKNENLFLPFSKTVKKVAVIGPNANDADVLLGNYNGYPTKPITPYQGIKTKLTNADVKFAQGCDLADEMPTLTPISAKHLYTDTTQSSKGLKAEYFNNATFEGDPAIVKMDTVIDFKWWTDGPGSTVNGKLFSARWSGFITPPKTGTYTIGGEGFSGYKIWIDGKLISQREANKHHAKLQTVKMYFEANKSYHLKIEYIQDHTDYAFMRLLWSIPQQDYLTEALSLVQESDLVVLCMGLSPRLEGEEMDVNVVGFDGGDRITIGLPSSQKQLIKAIHKLGKPTVLVLLNGSALAFNWEAEHLPAILEAWYPGQAGGTAIADILFGDYNPSGRLPVTFYKSENQLPPFDDYNMEGRTYRYFNDEPLYKFGHGLSYTSFSYNNLKLPDSLVAGEDLIVEAEVTNTGNLEGEEIVQLYVSHPNSSFRTPIRALKEFKAINLKPGESKSVLFTIPPEDLAVLNNETQYVIGNETITITVGGCQPDDKSIQTKQVINGELQMVVANGDYYNCNK